MPLRPPTPDELNEIKAQGLDPTGLMIDDSRDAGTPTGMSKTGAALATLKAHAGGTVGAGLGAMALPWLAGPEVGLPADIILGALGAFGGGWAGQKAQQKILPEETERHLEEQAQEAETEHPNISLATDIAAGALASGGSFSPSTAIRAVKGLRGVALTDAEKALIQGGMESGLSDASKSALAEDAINKAALKNVAIQSTINPAIGAGISYATSGSLPSAKDLLAQSVGGALFAKPSAMGEMFHRTPVATETEEPTVRTGLESVDTTKGMPEELQPKPAETGPWLDPKLIDNDAVRAAYKANFVPEKLNTEGLTPTQIFQEQTKRRALTRIPVQDMRKQLHDLWLKESAGTGTEPPKSTETGKTEPTGEITAKEPVTESAKETVPSVPVEVKPPEIPPVTKSPVTEAGETEEDLQNQLEPFVGAEPIRHPTETPEFKKWFEGSVLKNSEGKPLLLYHGTRDKEASFDIINPLAKNTTGKPREAGPTGLWTTPDVNYAHNYMAEWMNHSNYGEESDLHPSTGLQLHYKTFGQLVPVYANVKRILGYSGRYFEGEGENQLPVENPTLTREQFIDAVKRFGHYPENGFMIEGAKRVYGKSKLDPGYVYDHWGRGEHKPTFLDLLDYTNQNQITKQHIDNYKERETLRKFLVDNGFDAYFNSGNGRGEIALLKGGSQIKSAIGNRGTFDLNDPNITHTPQQNTGGFILSPEHIAEHLASGQATTGSVLEHFANLKDHPWAELAKTLRNTADQKSLATPWTLGGERSVYNSFKDQVRLSKLDVDYPHVIMEEAIHSMTSKKIPRFSASQGSEYYNRLQSYLKTGDNQSVKDIINAYLKVADHLGWHDQMFKDQSLENNEFQRGIGGNADEMSQEFGKLSGYGSLPYAMGNLDEFVAHSFKNKQFQKLLNEITYTEGKSIWQKIVDSVQKLLGIPVKQRSMLEHVLSRSSELISQERPIKNAIREPSTRGVLSHAQERTGETGSERERVGSSNEGKEIAEASPNKEVERPSKVAPTRSLPFGAERLFRAGLDTIRAIKHPLAQHTADQLQKVFQEREGILGRQLNPIIEASKKGGSYNKGIDERMTRAMRYELENKQDAPATMFRSAKERSLFQTAKQSLLQNFNERLANKEPVLRGNRPTMPQRDPYYWPTTSNPKVTAIYRENANTAEIQKLNKVFLDYQAKLGIDPKEAQQNLRDWVRAIQGSNLQSQGNQTYFNAARKAQGIPLPPEFTRPGFLRNLEAYFHAQSMDNAFYKHIESDPKAMAALGYTHSPWGQPVPQHEAGPVIGNTAVKNVMDEVRGEVMSGQQGQVQKKSESLATATILGPLTELHKVASNFAKQLTYVDNPFQAGKIIAHGIQHWSEGWTHAKENGKIVMTAKSAADMLDSQLTAADKIAALARGVRQVYTLNDLTDKWNLGMLQSMNEALVPYKIHAATQGDVAAQRLMKHLDPDWKPGKQYSPQDISQLASNLSGVIHGTRDARTLPSWMLHDNEISAFFKLSSWGIAQTNSFMRDVYTPALEGNFAPLMSATFGAAIGGYMLKELREKLAGKHSPIPSLQEIAASSRGLAGNIPAIAYNMMAASSYAGFGGMLSTIGRYPFDWAFKNQPQGATFPLDTVISDIATTASKAAEAIANDPNLNWLTLATHVGGHLMGTSFQLGRVALNQAIDSGTITGTLAEKKALNDKLQQLRRFDMVEGIPYGSQDFGAPSYLNLEQKKFKMEPDLGEAAKQAPALIQNIIQTYGNQPDVMMQKLKALKENPYATFPNISEMPLSFMKYWHYLNQLHGPAAAQQAIQDYMQHKVINEAKAGLVP